MRSSIRDLGVAFLALVASTWGLAALTPAPWWVGLIVGVLLGALLLLGDVRFFGRPVKREDREGKWAMVLLTLVVIATALLLSFLAGYAYKSEAERYAFIVTNSSGVWTPIKSVLL